jgi:hypothetical protein
MTQTIAVSTLTAPALHEVLAAPDHPVAPDIPMARRFADPGEVLDHPDLSPAEKRAILAAWASDACAVESAPGLRQWPGSAPIPVDEVLAALQALDPPAGGDVNAPHYRRLGPALQRRRHLMKVGDLKPLAWDVAAVGPLAKPRLMRH